MRLLKVVCLLFICFLGMSSCIATQSPKLVDLNPYKVSSGVFEGELEGALYRIEVPEVWNGHLVLYAHGYLPDGMTWKPITESNRAEFLNRGFAFAESGFSSNGWAVREGREDTLRLKTWFAENIHPPKEAYVTGHSMGGFIAVDLIEEHPDQFDGALPMCAPVGNVTEMFERRMFDLLVAFEWTHREALKLDRPILEVQNLSGIQVVQALRENQEATRRLASRFGVQPNDLVQLLPFFHIVYKDLLARVNGQPLDNRDTIYDGLGNAAEVNREIRRVTADPEARAKLLALGNIEGSITDPVLLLTTIYDPVISPRNTTSFMNQMTSTQDDFPMVVQWIEQEGHCVIPAPVLGDRFDALLEWVREGVRPNPGLHVTP